ncbi:MAG: DNA polymerase Y family protein [Planctomycetota bacterium]
MRIACLLVPLFPLAARLRSEPELAREAVVIFEGEGPAAKVVAATRVVREAGVRAGMSLPQARGLLPKLIARGRDAECERAAQSALLEAAETLSPNVEDAGPGQIYLDVSGLDRLFPGPAGEADVGRAALSAAAAQGLPARVGIASGKLAARLAAASPPSPRIVPRGEERAFLAPLRIEKLQPPAALLDTLTSWGIRTLGELSRLPVKKVATRLGEEGQKLHAAARGVDQEILLPRREDPVYREGLVLEWPLVALEPFLYSAEKALERLVRRLESRGLGCRRLLLSLQLEPEGFEERSLELPVATLEVKTLCTLVRLHLEENPPRGPLVGFTFTAQPDRPRTAQLSLFGPAELSPDRVATTLARLATRLGPGRAGTPRPEDGHRPERGGRTDFAPPPAPDFRPPERRSRGLLGLRVLRPALPLEVIVREEAGARQELVSLRTLMAGEAGVTSDEKVEKRPQIEGTVRVAAGPWRLEDRWWGTDGEEREYWDVELSSGVLARIYRDAKTTEWFADGLYD